MRFPTSPAPHVVRPRSVSRVMSLVLVMLIPATVVHVLLFGSGLLLQMVIATGAALAAEAVMLKLRSQPLRPALTDYSAPVTAVLLAFALPPLAPWWLAASGAAFAVIFAKHLFGGLGRNLFNPAMVGYAALLLSFPAQMTLWPEPGIAPRPGFFDTALIVLTGTPPGALAWDAITGATPLDAVRTGLIIGQTMQETRAASLFGSFGGKGSEWLALAIFAGGIGLLATKIIRWHIPAAMLGTIIVMTGFLHSLDPGMYPDVLFQLTSGATLLGAFFIACDPVTTAASDRGRLLFGAGVGVLVVVIRTWGHYPDGVAFAVLIMNAFVPLLDRYTVPRIYGHTQRP